MEPFELITGECVATMAAMESNSIDAIVTDPPAGISFMGKEWDHHKGGRDQWIAWMTVVMTEAFRVAKPGAHAFVWALPRTSHWTATALEDAGWEIRDVVTHLFGSGFPKSLDVSKAIDKAAGAEREVVGINPNARQAVTSYKSDGRQTINPLSDAAITAPATEAAQEWDGWGTALKPASEHWILARKPLIDTVVANVLTHGTGAINVAACRIEGELRQFDRSVNTGMQNGQYGAGITVHRPSRNEVTSAGRWPANVVLDEEAAAMLDEMTGETRSTKSIRKKAGLSVGNSVTLNNFHMNEDNVGGFDDSGGASRFFYVAKASRTERNAGLEGMPEEYNDFQRESSGLSQGKNPITGERSGKRLAPQSNFHPTVKPVTLMRWLTRLICPPGGVILDPFAGSGSTGCAAMLEGFRFVGIEQDAEYCEIAARRIRYWAAQPKQMTL